MAEANRGLLKHHLAWGLGLGTTVVLAIQILTWVGLGLSHLTWISTWALVVVFALLASRSLARRLGDRPTVLQAVVLIAAMILVSRMMYQTYMFLYIHFVDAAWVDTVADVWSTQLREAGKTEEAIEKNIASFRKQWETGYVFTLGIVSYAAPQLVLGLLAAILGAVRPWKKLSRPRDRAPNGSPGADAT